MILFSDLVEYYSIAYVIGLAILALFTLVAIAIYILYMCVCYKNDKLNGKTIGNASISIVSILAFIGIITPYIVAGALVPEVPADRYLTDKETLINRSKINNQQGEVQND